MNNSPHKREIKYEADDGYPWEKDAKNGPEIYQSAAIKQSAQAMPTELIFGRPLKWYFDVLVWPMFILLVLEIGFRVMQTKYFPALPEEIFLSIINFIRIGCFVYLSIIGARQFLGIKKQIIIASVLGGFLVGFVLAIFQLVWYFELWTFFNLIGQPLLLAALGFLISWIFLFLFKNKLRLSK